MVYLWWVGKGGGERRCSIRDGTTKAEMGMAVDGCMEIGEEADGRKETQRQLCTCSKRMSVCP